MNKKIIIAVICIIIACIGYYSFEKNSENRKEKEVTLYGNIDIRDVALGFRVHGKIEKLYYEEGDTIKEGDVLASLSKDTFQQDIDLNIAKLREAKAILNNAEKTYQREENLFRKGAVSNEAYDDALEKRDAAKASLEIAKVNLSKSQLSFKDTDIISLNDGIILTRIREPGAILSIGEPVYTVALNNPVWVRTYIDEPNLGKIYPGQKATVTTDSGNKYEGQVGFISPQAEFTPKKVETTELRTELVYRLRVIVNNPDNALRQGMPVTVKLEEKTQG